MACSSLSQAPKSSNRQRSLQKGLNGLDQSTAFLQCGQRTSVGATAQVQQVSTKGTSPSACVGRLRTSLHSRKRMLQRWWLPLISG